MLAKCANSECSHVFRYFGAGKLFRLTGCQGGRIRAVSHIEHFWLCADCAPKMTLAVERDGKAVVIPRAVFRTYREIVGKISRVPEVSPAVLGRSASLSALV